MPKQKITKDMVVDAAFQIARSQGMESVLVKNIADKIGCSVQPIYSYCHNMEGLKSEVIDRVNRFVREYVTANLNHDDLFRSTGQAYIKLTEEEPHIFKIFILQKREGVSSLAELYQSETNPEMAEFIAKQLNISPARAANLHLHMLIYTIGIGTIFSVTTPGISAEEIFAQQASAYQAFLKQAIEQNAESARES